MLVREGELRVGGGVIVAGDSQLDTKLARFVRQQIRVVRRRSFR
jgi:hypothetical protein